LSFRTLQQQGSAPPTGAGVGTLPASGGPGFAGQAVQQPL